MTTEQIDPQQEQYTNLINSLPSRWEIELEFVQSLSNIPYVNYLAQNNYLNDETFVNYLEYLQYWTQPQYAKFLVYPNCLHVLKLLQDENFRKNIINQEFMNSLMNDMVKRWQNNELDEQVLTEKQQEQPQQEQKVEEEKRETGEVQPVPVENGSIST
ncbi:Mediator of RNA polymerase II transcription subunit 31 [Candida viswanathii]|uniref:Mediator of RNA polymerase II transcription subunit 31 n=1 Tax=Candida viswanathii TaxID=5486 RepID=A0A367XM89_9ASCO|nr:Mediator of RNA polymerase II transcription subunit 31 [Candida viswanathii]